MIRDNIILLGGAAVIGYAMIKRFVPSSGDLIRRITRGVVYDSDGNADIAATIGAVNPSGIPPASDEQVRAAKLAVMTGTAIVYRREALGGESIDAAATAADVAYSLGFEPTRHFWGSVDVEATLDNLELTLGDLLGTITWS